MRIMLHGDVVIKNTIDVSPDGLVQIQHFRKNICVVFSAVGMSVILSFSAICLVANNLYISFVTPEPSAGKTVH